MKAALRRAMPRSVWNSASAIKAAILDSRDKLFGRTNTMRPPRTANFVGSGDFKKVGAEFRKLFIDLGGLKPTDDVLDVGSGIGRMAVPLTQYLAPDSHYAGFDIVQRGVEWCSANITSHFPNFTFKHVDIYNKEYNPEGTIKGRNFVFPYESSSFDFVFLTSVFTHMLPVDVERYLNEICRVLKPGGRSFITWLLYDNRVKDVVSLGKAALDVRYPLGECYVLNRDVPEDAIAYPLPLIENLYNRTGLSLIRPIYRGAWSAHPDAITFQDVCIASKPAS